MKYLDKILEGLDRLSDKMESPLWDEITVTKEDYETVMGAISFIKNARLAIALFANPENYDVYYRITELADTDKNGGSNE